MDAIAMTKELMDRFNAVITIIEDNHERIPVDVINKVTDEVIRAAEALHISNMVREAELIARRGK